MTEVLGRMLAAGDPDGRLHGVSCGTVTNIEDPAGQGRVKVRLGWMADDAESNWARIAVTMAGSQRGTWFPPAVGDEVLVAFEHGSPEFPYVLGALWNGVDAPPVTDAEQRVITTGAGHEIRLVDGPDDPHVEIRSGDARVLVATSGKVTVTAGTDVEITAAGGSLALGASGVTLSGDGDVTVSARGRLVLSGSLVTIN